MYKRMLGLGLVLLSGGLLTAADARERTVTIFFTGMVLGNYEPCG